MVYTRLTLKGFVDPLKPKGRQILRMGYIGAIFDGWEHDVIFWFERSLGKLIEKTDNILIEGDLSLKKANPLGDVLQFSEEKVKVHFDSKIEEIKVYAVMTSHREKYDRIRKWDNSVKLTKEEQISKDRNDRLRAQMEKKVAAKRKEIQVTIDKFAKNAKNKMGNDVFWSIIDKSKELILGQNNIHAQQYEYLLKILQKLSPPEIFTFYYIFQKKYFQAAHYSYLLPIYYTINGGIVSENKYNEFIGWIIAQGRIIYENILRNPDYISSILDYKKPFPIYGPNYDIYSLVIPQAAVDAYVEVNGRYFTNEEYAALVYSREFNDSLMDEKGKNIASIMDPNLDWAIPPNRDILVEHFPKTFEKFGKWMVTLHGDFQTMTPENQRTFMRLIKEEVEGWENDPTEPPVVIKRTLVSKKVQCPCCNNFVEEGIDICPYCQSSLKK